MKKQQASRVFRPSRSLKRLGRSVGRCNRKSIALQAVVSKTSPHINNARIILNNLILSN